MDVRVGLWRKLSTEELMLLNVVLEKTLESPLDSKEIQPVHPNGDQSQVFTGRTDAEAETPVVWPPHAKSWFIGKDPDAGRAWGQEEKGTTEDEMVGWHHQLNGHEWIWVNSGSWWWTGSPAVLWFMGSQRVGHDWATELNWTETGKRGRLEWTLRCLTETGDINTNSWFLIGRCKYRGKCTFLNYSLALHAANI